MGDDFEQPTPGIDASPDEALDSFNDWLYLAQVQQARALDMGVTWFRALHPYCSGALYWQLNDCWPVSSWSAIDSDGRLKPLWYASRRFFAPRLLTIKPRAVVGDIENVGPLAVFAHNDADQPWRGELRLRKMHLDGRTLEEHAASLDAAPRGSVRLDVPDAWHDDPDQAYLVAQTDATPDAARGFWWFAHDKAMEYPPADFDAQLESSGTHHRLTVTAKSLLRDLCVFAERLDPSATVSDQAVTLLPGESFVFTIASDRPPTLEQLTQPPVMQTVNRFGRRIAMA